MRGCYYLIAGIKEKAKALFVLLASPLHPHKRKVGVVLNGAYGLHPSVGACCLSI